MTGPIKLVRRPVSDIPGMMRAMADAIENGERGEIRFGVGVFMSEDGTPFVAGRGADASDMHALGLWRSPCISYRA